MTSTMPSSDDIAAISQMIAVYGHVVDGREWHRLRELFSDDLTFVPWQEGAAEIHSLDDLIEMWQTPGFPHPSGHHATNILVEVKDASVMTATWKGISVHRNGQCRSLIYHERLRLTPDGWRIFWHRVESRPTDVDPVAAGQVYGS